MSDPQDDGEVVIVQQPTTTEKLAPDDRDEHFEKINMSDAVVSAHNLTLCTSSSSRRLRRDKYCCVQRSRSFFSALAYSAHSHVIFLISRNLFLNLFFAHVDMECGTSC